RGDHRRLDLRVPVVPVGEERSDRAVDQTTGEDLLGRRTPLAFEKAPGELASRARLLAVVDGERKEIYIAAGLGRGRGAEVQRLSVADHDGAVRLLGDLSGVDRKLAPGNFSFDLKHLCVPSTSSSALDAARVRPGNGLFENARTRDARRAFDLPSSRPWPLDLVLVRSSPGS